MSRARISEGRVMGCIALSLPQSADGRFSVGKTSCWMGDCRQSHSMEICLAWCSPSSVAYGDSFPQGKPEIRRLLPGMYKLRTNRRGDCRIARRIGCGVHAQHKRVVEGADPYRACTKSAQTRRAGACSRRCSCASRHRSVLFILYIIIICVGIAAESAGGHPAKSSKNAGIPVKNHLRRCKKFDYVKQMFIFCAEQRN